MASPNCNYNGGRVDLKQFFCLLAKNRYSKIDSSHEKSIPMNDSLNFASNIKQT